MAEGLHLGGDQRLWVVCPSYTDVPAFTLLRKRLLELLDDAIRLDAVRFVVIDDTAGSDPDITQLELYDDVTVICPPFNLGHQRALVYGLRRSLPGVHDDDVIVTMDADGEDRPEDVLRLIAPLLAPDASNKLVCIARRTKRKESLQFRVLYLAFVVLFRLLTGVTVRSGNFAAYRGQLARRILHHPYFDLCYSSTLVSLDMAVHPVPCARGDRYAGRSRMTLLRLLIHGIRMLMPFTDRIAIRALVMFSALFGLGILLTFGVLIAWLFTSTSIPAWTTAGVVALLGLSFIALGNFVVLFAVFSTSRGISLADLEREN